MANLRKQIDMTTDSTNDAAGIPTTVEIRNALEAIETDFEGTIDGWFGEIEERLTEVQDVLRSAALRKILVELGKLRATVVEKIPEAITVVRNDLEEHDGVVEDAIESAAQKASENAEAKNAA
ncbi:MAG: hypothetical protein QM784_00525 [Polyangiaceae bacterium]